MNGNDESDRTITLSELHYECGCQYLMYRDAALRIDLCKKHSDLVESVKGLSLDDPDQERIDE